jgi:hypothetical protein
MAMNDILRQAQQMQRKLNDVQQEVANKTVEASVGGGMITVTVNGNRELTKIDIDPSVVDPNDLEMLQDLILAAVNEGVSKAKKLMDDSVAEVTGGVNIPGLF